jgi:RNA polymerase sigma-70 factor (ECF subfamily)
MSEKEIIVGLKKKDPLVFKTFVEQNQNMVVNTCFGLLRNHEDAEDIAQDVFIEVYESINSFREESKLSTWLYRISINKCLNLIKKNKYKKWFFNFQSHEDKEKRIIQIVDKKSIDPHIDMEQKERADILHNALETLSENQKTVFTLSKYEKLSNKEIAIVLNTSVSSVESLIHRAKKNLRKKLYKYYKNL